MSKTIQRGDLTEYGQHYIITPETTETFLNKISCLMLNGTGDAPVGPQHILPDISNFSVSVEVFLEPSQMSVMQLQVNLKPFTILAKKLNHRCLTWF